MADKNYIALEATSQEIKTAVESVQTDVDTANGNISQLKDTDVPAIDEIVDAVLERIGLTSDTGGSSTAGTIMGKLNALQSGGGFGFSLVASGTCSSTSATTVYTSTNCGFILHKGNESASSSGYTLGNVAEKSGGITIDNGIGVALVKDSSDRPLVGLGIFEANSTIKLQCNSASYPSSYAIFEFN